MRLAVNLLLSLAVLALCVWLVWPDAHVRHEMALTLRALELRTFWPVLAGYVGLLAVTHFFRAYRWHFLLKPIGIDLSLGRLLAVSSISFMAILALPARLGEFARPALMRRHGSASAVLGTVAVERVIDGLGVTLLVFLCFFERSQALGAAAPGWMWPAAWASMAVFGGALVFLGLAIKWPDQTIEWGLALTLTPRFAPRLARGLELFARKVISGFLVLKDLRNLGLFCLWTAVYWLANAAGMWVLARGMGLDISFVASLAVMGVVAVGITLPNAPGLVGQFHYFTTLALTLYVAKDIAESTGLAYAIMLHGIQVVWYILLGIVGMAATRTTVHDLLGRVPEGELPAAEATS